MAGNDEFLMFKKKVIKATVEEIEEQVAHAAVTWEFLIGFAEKKKVWRNRIVEVFHKLAEVPGWLAAYRDNTALHEKLRGLHEDLQSALGAQHDVIKSTISPGALKSMHLVKMEDKPEAVKHAIEKEKLVDEIRDETNAQEAHFEAHSAPSVEENADSERLKALQEGIDAVASVGAQAIAGNGGLSELNQLRIGVIQCMGHESLFQHEVNESHKVFSFLLMCAKERKDLLTRVAEVMYNIMLSQSWAADFQGSQPLKDSLLELPDEVQAALAAQSDIIKGLVAQHAREKAEKGEVTPEIKSVAQKMATIRVAVAESAAPPAPVPPVEEKWKEAKTPEGHIYYYNTKTRESVWQRPDSLGGPIVFSPGDRVEVWSNSQRMWGQGKVEKVEGGKVLVEFTFPGSTAPCKKEVPAGHKDLKLLGSMPAKEGISAEEKAAYEALFKANTGGQAQVAILGKSGLPRQALKQIWAVANPGGKAELSLEEFELTCRLIASCQALGASSDLVVKGERPLRLKLREEFQFVQPPFLAKFS